MKTRYKKQQSSGHSSHSFFSFLFDIKDRFSLIVIWFLLAVNVVLILSLVHKFLQPGDTEPLNMQNPLSVEILNGCGEPGLANVFASCLEQKRYRIASVGNAPDFDFAKTLIFDRCKKNQDVIRNFQESLGLDSDRIVLVRQDQGTADVTLIIGCDYASLDCFQSQ